MSYTTSPARADDNTRPQPVPHDGPCGIRCAAPCGRTWGPYNLAEALPGDRVRCHGCSRVLSGLELTIARTGRCAA